ncbi:MAG: hypothetical protein IJN80_00290 [Clostridia bacterium]|nr:hypothetical protein [Clostridia bacterium]
MAEYALGIGIGLLFYFYTVTCVFFTVRVAALKGRRKRWGWLALFLGLIGFLVVCFLPNGKGVSGETNPVKAAFRQMTGLSPLATWLIAAGLVVIVGGALIGTRLGVYLENRAYEKELSEKESNENALAPASVYGTVERIFAGKGRNYAITDQGDLYGWGNVAITPLDESGRLYEKVQKVATVGETTLLLTTDGTLYGKGNNTNGLIAGAEEKNVKTFTKIESDVLDFDLGETAAALITKRKNLYIWGVNTYGQLAKDVEKRAEITDKIASDIQKVEVTARSVYYLNESGEVYGVGNNAYGQFGLGDKKVRYGVAKIASSCKDFAAGEDFLMLLKKDGSVWTCGNDAFGQLGRKTMEELSESEKKNLEKAKEKGKEEKIQIKKAAEFGQVDLPEEVSKVEGAGHSAFALIGGNVYGWGENQLGQLGTGSNKNCASPELVYRKAADLSASGSCTLILSEDGALLGAGDRRDHQLGAQSGHGFKSIAQIKEGE